MLKYEAYKDSGATWIGNVPSTWEVDRLKKHLKRVDAKNPGGVQVLSLYRELGIIPKDSRDDNHNVTSEDTSKYKYVQPGDFVVNKMKAWQGSVAVSDYEGIVSPAYYVYKFLDDRFHKRYFHYLIRSCYKEEFMRISAGIHIGQWDLSSDDLDCVPVLLPTKKEQVVIADFLDTKITHIDSVIAEAKASIEEYKAWKASIIYEAVTKGLDPDVEMKDSGVEWIGMMPHEWQLIATKHLMAINHGCDPQTEGDVPVYGSGASSFKTCGEFKEGPAVLIGRKGATLHIPHYITGKYWNVDTAFDVTSKNKKLNLKYYYYLANCFDYKYYMSQTTLPSMTQTSYNSMKLPVPSIEHQTLIVSWLDSKTSEIETLTNEKEALVADLEAYKKSLIFEVVTGKRRVC